MLTILINLVNTRLFVLWSIVIKTEGASIMFKLSSIDLKFIVTIIISLGVIGVSCSKNSNEVKSKIVGTEIGQKAPNFEVYSMSGNKVTLEDYRGKLLFVNFWGWWCPPCIREAEILMKIAKKYEGRIAFLFVGVNTFYRDKEPLDPKEFADGFAPGLERYKKGLQKAKLVRPGETDKNDPQKLASISTRNNQVINYYMTSETSLFDFRGYWERQFRAKTNERYGIPVTYLIDREGRIALDINPNEQHWDKNDDILEDLIAGKNLSHYSERFPIPPHHQRQEKADN